MINLVRKNKIRFAVDVVRINTEEESEIIGLGNYAVVIVLKNYNTDIAMPNCLLTHFLQESYSGRCVKTVENNAYYIVKFINEVLFDKNYIYKIKSLLELKFIHGSEYLNQYGISKSRSSVKMCEKTLIKFYYYLAQKRLSKYFNLGDFTINEGIIETPFKVNYPNTITSSILHHLPQELISAFLNLAFKHSNDIALGVYLQFFGGLRIGDVVNLTYDDIGCYGVDAIYGMSIRITEKNMRPDLKRYSIREGVKKERTQVIFTFRDYLSKFYSSHRSKYKSVMPIDAVFINSKGLPMTKSLYRQKFNNLKKVFIKSLGNSDDLVLKTYAVTLLGKKWSTHLGRGVFSNQVAEVAQNALEIATARGDSNLDSALSYLSDTEKLGKKVEDNLNKMYKKMSERYSEIE
jgi:integrase